VTLAENERPSLSDYPIWLKNQHGVDTASLSAVYYDSVTQRMKHQFETGAFWRGWAAAFSELNDEYVIHSKGYPLWTGPNLPAVLIKPHRSFIEKTYRHNIVQNTNWPDAPPSGWALPTNWYSMVNDVVRATAVVKYLDGVTFLTERLRILCEGHGEKCDVAMEARAEGYYAAHLYIHYSCEIPKENWDTRRVRSRMELQLTTQLKDVITQLTHKFYERKRIKIENSKEKWQWDYQSDEFAANYLGHMLHYLDGMIMALREREEKKIG
jgi:hypothetical protein